MTRVYIFDGSAVRGIESPAGRPLRWAAWRPDGAFALVAGNRGEVLRFSLDGFEPLAPGVAHNLRGVAWSPDGARALLVGNRGAIVMYAEGAFRELAAPTVENLRRVAWSPDGSCALIIGNGGCVLRYDAAAAAPASERVVQLPGDRAHTFRSVAWRPDGTYALIGAYASRRAGYPPPYTLYRCDGRYVQGILATDDEDDANAIDWQPGRTPARALALVARYGEDDALLPGKIVSYDGSGFSYRTLPSMPAGGGVVTLLGLGWHPSGEYALLCGERGKLLVYRDGRMSSVRSGTEDNLVGPFWQPGARNPVALLLQGPEDRTYTV